MLPAPNCRQTNQQLAGQHMKSPTTSTAKRVKRKDSWTVTCGATKIQIFTHLELANVGRGIWGAVQKKTRVIFSVFHKSDLFLQRRPLLVSLDLPEPPAVQLYHRAITQVVNELRKWIFVHFWHKFLPFKLQAATHLCVCLHFLLFLRFPPSVSYCCLKTGRNWVKQNKEILKF